jgi:hypothetical protein
LLAGAACRAAIASAFDGRGHALAALASLALYAAALAAASIQIARSRPSALRVGATPARAAQARETLPGAIVFATTASRVLIRNDALARAFDLRRATTSSAAGGFAGSLGRRLRTGIVDEHEIAVIVRAPGGRDADEQQRQASRCPASDVVKSAHARSR